MRKSEVEDDRTGDRELEVEINGKNIVLLCQGRESRRKRIGGGCVPEVTFLGPPKMCKVSPGQRQGGRALQTQGAVSSKHKGTEAENKVSFLNGK